MGRGRGPNTADSYIGSLISLTSKSEIRYEGILYTVDTENSNIALQNVRSYGTEGRKKDGPQIPASDKVYDYIIFRGSDIKDLQVKSSPPPPLQPPPPSQPTDPAIISLQQSQPQYPPPSSLGSYNGGAPAAGSSSSEPSAPPLPYMGMPPSQYRGPVLPLYPPAGMQSWGPPPPPPGANGSGMAMPMYWQGYYRPPPAGHMQHQPMPPQPPPSLAAPPQGQQQQQQAPQAPSLPPQLPAVSRPPQAESSSLGVQAASVASSVSPAVPLMAATTTPASTAVSSPVCAVSTSASPVASSSIGTTTASGSVSGAPVSAASSLPSPIQGVSAVITPMRSDSRRSVGMVSQGLQQSALVPAAGSSPPKVEPKAVEPANVATSAMVQTSSQGAPAQEQVSQPLLPLPSAEQTQQAMAQQRGGQSVPVGQRNRWQGNGNYSRRGRGRGSGNGRGRGIGLANPTRKFTEDFDFTAMNEKFNKDEVWGALGGKGENVTDEGEYDDDDGHVEEDIPDPAESDASKKVLYKKDDFFDSLSCDALDRREGGRGEQRTKFSEQRKIDTETFGAFLVRSRGRGGRRGGYRGGYYGGGGSYGIGSGNGGYSRGRGSRPSSAIV